jgi:hypothetical protein
MELISISAVALPLLHNNSNAITAQQQHDEQQQH